MLKALEITLFISGIVLLGVFAAEFGVRQVQAKQAVDSFEQNKSLAAIAPDVSLWSPERIIAYKASLKENQEAIGVIRINSVSIEAPIFIGDSDSVLDSGVGWIEGTAELGEAGNVGLAAHRDGFFRALKDIKKGDQIDVSSSAGDKVYVVTGTAIISPLDNYVLEPTARSALTLVTCHPFYFVGDAPNRFVVYATELDLVT